MKKRRRNAKVEAVTASDVRLKELAIRLAHAKLAGDAEKVESIERKMSRAMGQAARVRRKIGNGGR